MVLYSLNTSQLDGEAMLLRGDLQTGDSTEWLLGHHLCGMAVPIHCFCFTYSLFFLCIPYWKRALLISDWTEIWEKSSRSQTENNRPTGARNCDRGDCPPGESCVWFHPCCQPTASCFLPRVLAVYGSYCPQILRPKPCVLMGGFFGAVLSWSRVQTLIESQ